MRVDKYIWCARLCKTRTIASKEVAADKVKLNDDFVKTSKEVKVGDRIALKKGPIWRKYEVLSIPKSRVGAALVAELISEFTPKEDLETLERIELENRLGRQHGIIGRPTKKSRRDIDRFREDLE